jgi:hypothetical protein
MCVCVFRHKQMLYCIFMVLVEDDGIIFFFFFHYKTQSFTFQIYVTTWSKHNKAACSPIQETIQNAVEDSITWPVRKVVPILPGDYRYVSARQEMEALWLHFSLFFPNKNYCVFDCWSLIIHSVIVEKHLSNFEWLIITPWTYHPRNT